MSIYSIIEQAKMQDEEREISKDEEIYKTTGKNIAYDENMSDPLVPIDGTYSIEKNLTNAQMAKKKRIMDRQNEIRAKMKEQEQEKIRKHEEQFKNGLSFLEA